MATYDNSSQAQPKQGPLRVYLDTQPLSASQWPKASVALQNLVSLAARVRVQSFVPTAVENEAQYFRDYREKLQQLASAQTRLNQHHIRVGITDAGFPSGPKDDEVLTRYPDASLTL